MNNKNASSGGITLSGLTFLVFLVLKLCGVINWSWWWVTCPLWGPLALVIAIFIVYLLVILCIDGLGAIFKKKRRR